MPMVGRNFGYRKSRSLYRERGLKFKLNKIEDMPVESFPLQGTWIEIRGICMDGRHGDLSFPLQGTWIEMLSLATYFLCFRSFPLQGTWIEIILREYEEL